MARLKTIFISALICVLIAAGAVYWVYRYQKTYSFAPDRPEQAAFARKHAECAAFFYVMNRKEIQSAKGDLAKAKGERVGIFKTHAELGLNFSPDKAAFQASLEESIQRFADLIVATKDVDRIRDLVNAKEASCYRLIQETAEFAMDVKGKK